MTAYGRVLALEIVSIVSLGFGLTLPVLTVRPGFGEYGTILRALSPESAAPRSISILAGILDLFREAHHLPATLLLVFSVLFPLWKHGVVCESLFEVRSGLPVTKQLGVIDRWGKYSMLDVLVIAVLVLVIKSFPGGTTVSVGPGLGFFAVSVLSSLKVPRLVAKLDAEGHL